MTGQGIIVSINGNKAQVKVTSGYECTGCSNRSTCHTTVNTKREITVLNEFGAQITDKVLFEAEPGKVIFSATLIWILPIISMIVGYLVGEQFGSGFLPVAAAFLFLGLTFLLLKVLDNLISGGKTFYPRITAVVDSFPETAETCGKE
jgi:sigma-E factor negative regulatory protein RseC